MSSTKMKAQVFNFLEKADGHLEHLKQVYYVNDYTVEKGILNCANDMNADLIAIATHGRTGISHFFSGSISEDIANHASKPVMTFKI
nr:universal stress protein [Lacinutrix neustonica]